MILRSFTLVKRVRSLFLKTLARQKFKVSNKIAAMKSINQTGGLHLLYKPLWGGGGGGGGEGSTMAYTKRLRPKGVPFQELSK